MDFNLEVVITVFELGLAFLRQSCFLVQAALELTAHPTLVSDLQRSSDLSLSGMGLQVCTNIPVIIIGNLTADFYFLCTCPDCVSNF